MLLHRLGERSNGGGGGEWFGLPVADRLEVRSPVSLEFQPMKIDGDSCFIRTLIVHCSIVVTGIAMLVTQRQYLSNYCGVAAMLDFGGTNKSKQAVVSLSEGPRVPQKLPRL